MQRAAVAVEVDRGADGGEDQREAGLQAARGGGEGGGDERWRDLQEVRGGARDQRLPTDSPVEGHVQGETWGQGQLVQRLTRSLCNDDSRKKVEVAVTFFYTHMTQAAF